MKNKFGKFSAMFLAATMVFTATGTVEVFAAPTVMYESKEVETISKDVTYEIRRQVTDEGFRDIYVLKAPIGDPNIQFQVANSEKATGYKETVKTLLQESDAIAGVNGDFFGVKGSYSASSGMEVNDGNVESIGMGSNDKGMATFYIENEVNPYMTYTTTDIDFINNGVENIEVFAINKVTDMVMPIIVDQNAMTDTSPIDEKFPNTLKVVVEDGLITYKSQKGETVNVPENGYVLVIGENSADYFQQFFDVGQTAELKIESGVNLENVTTGIGGASMILNNGQVVADGLVIEGDQPRTAMGITQDNKNLILMVVDGRGHSFGASHQDMADLMLEYGAYNAMHLDGGGSSTMAVKTPADTEVQVVNNVSDGSERKVINAFGIYDVSQPGPATSLKITGENYSDVLIQGVANPIRVVGVDDYLHESEIPRDQVTITSDDPAGRFEGNTFYPSKEGTIHFKATYGNITGEADLTSKKLAEIQPNLTEIRLHAGESASLTFNGIVENGDKALISSGIVYEVVPPEIGHMENGTFVADKDGSGYLKCSVGDVTTNIPVYVGGKTETIYSFEGDKPLTFANYPDNVTGTVEYTGTQKTDGAKSVKISYNFAASPEPQAAYAKFEPSMQLTGKPSSLTVDAFGDKSGLLLRGQITDANGEEFRIDFTRNMNFSGWQKLTAPIPSNAVYPISLDRIYVASTSTEAPVSGSVYVDNLRADYPIETGNIQIPASDKYTTGGSAPLPATVEVGSFDITALPKMNLYAEEVVDPEKPQEIPANYAEVQNKAMNQFKQNTKRGLFIGETDIPNTNQGVGITQWNPSYFMHTQDNVGILQMSASEGGFFATDKTQWQKFSTDIQNSGKDHIIITMDTNPLKFNDPEEFEMFVDELVKLEETGKNIFVVSTQGTDTTEENVEGITFINLGSLWLPDETVNPDFRILRFRVNGKDISYELQPLK